MSYRVRLTGGDDIKVDDTTGKKLLEMIETNKREGFFHSGKDLYLAKDVRAVVFLGEEVNEDAKKAADLEAKDKEYDVKLEKWSREDSKTKAIREVKVRIKPLTKFIEPMLPMSETAKSISEWFDKNPEYPWCPINVWLEPAFGKRTTYPYYLNLVARHESRVNRWLATFKHLEPAEMKFKTEDLVNFYIGDGGDLDD